MSKNIAWCQESADTSLLDISFVKEGTLCFSYPSTVGILPPRNFPAGILQNFFCNHAQSRTFLSTLRSSQISSEVTTHPWK